MTVATTISLPVIDISTFLSNPGSKESISECLKLASAAQEFGAFAVRDTRVTEQQNSDFLDLMEDYFDQEWDAKLKDARPELSYQVGATPELTELPR